MTERAILALQDGTTEGLCHKESPILSIQYHSESCRRPQDSVHLFERFLVMVKG